VVPADQEANTVVTVLQKGYTIADRVLRPALVTVAGPPLKHLENAGNHASYPQVIRAIHTFKLSRDFGEQHGKNHRH
jgi:hypothetical protein